ncbi:MAG TPA: poly(A) polymerase [Pseudobdellovibrionaceae bacterium]|nr:poly(A) polymerase [Pseudobdellovibrionaceae bacterium]
MQERKPYLHEDWIDPQALKIVKTLQREGFETYLVGGCVRDLLVGIHPKDFDIATSAHPPQVKRLIHRSNIIGRRFRLVLVRRYDSQFEISTFRRNQIVEELEAEAESAIEAEAAVDIVEMDSNIQEAPGELHKVILNDNFFGTAEEDASRRDFTVNSLFYDPSARKIVDHCQGLKDIEQNIIRMIGDPYLRFVEDPIRILRAIRLSHKIGFKLDPLLRAAIPKAAMELKKTVLPRRREEYLKILKLDDPLLALFEIYDLQVMDVIFPSLVPVFSDQGKLEIFSTYFKRFKVSKMDSKDNAQLFSHFLMCYLKAQWGEGALNLDALYKDREVLNFMKDEMGMFKAESAIFFKALELLPSLNDIDYYLRKGERRRKGFLKSEGLDLALSFGRLECSLSPGVLNFWEGQF